MRRRCIVLLGAFPGSLLSGTGAKAEPRQLDLACYSSQTLGGKPEELFADKATELSSGTIQIAVEVVPATVPFQMISKASALASYYGPGFSKFEPVLALSAVPMLAATFDEAEALLRIARPYYSAALARHGQKLLATYPWRPAALWSTFRIRSVGDFKGAAFALASKFLAGQEGVWERPFMRLGVRNASFFDAEVVLSNGYLDNLTFTQQFTSFTEIFFAAQLCFLTMDQDLFESLSESHRQVLTAAGRETEPMLWNLTRDLVARDHQEISARGVLVAAQPPADVLAALRTAAEPDIQSWAESMGGDGPHILTDYRRAIGRR
jgi:TRAP-type C4-dicarboxylate transport system substrate-binding protein